MTSSRGKMGAPAMTSSRAFGFFAILVSLGFMSGCATESVPEPEPTIFTRGAFVAVRQDDGTLRLSRTLDTFETELDTSLIETEYDVRPRTFEEAVALARWPGLPIRLLVTVSSGTGVLESEHEVVWYRTLTEEERARAE